MKRSIITTRLRQQLDNSKKRYAPPPAPLVEALPAGANVLVGRVDGAHVAGVVALADAAAEVLLVQGGEGVAVEFDAEAGGVGAPDRPAGETQRRARRDLL